jgi:DNA-directed RNA polymerase II subunit RPB3
MKFIKEDTLPQRPNKLSFVIEDVDVSVVNALRRTVLSNIPNVAFDASDPESIHIMQNTCSLHNEFLSHRLSMVPLCFAPELIDDGRALKYRFTLKKANNTNTMLAVTSADFEIEDAATGRKLPLAEREAILPSNGITKSPILLTKLKPNFVDKSKGDALHIVAEPRLGTAKKHACWSPVSICTYFNVVDQAGVPEAFERYKQANPELDVETARRRFRSLAQHRVFRRNVHGEPNAFVFSIETECRMSPAYVFAKAVRVLQEQVNGILEDFPNFKITDLNGVYAMYMPGYDHTVGNMMQALIYNMYIRDAAAQSKTGNNIELVSYIGYFQPHPNEHAIVLKIKCAVPPLDLMKSATQKITLYLEDVLRAFESAKLQ